MGLIVIDGSPVRNFVNDEETFDRQMDECFASIDVNSDGLLTRRELRRAFENFHLFESNYEIEASPEQIAELYNNIFGKVEFHCDETVNSDEFKNEMKNLFYHIADALDACPLEMEF